LACNLATRGSHRAPILLEVFLPVSPQQDLPNHSRSFTLAIAFHVSILDLQMEDRLDGTHVADFKGKFFRTKDRKGVSYRGPNELNWSPSAAKVSQFPNDVSETDGCARTGCTTIAVVGYGRTDVMKQGAPEVGVFSAVHGGSRGGGNAEQMRAEVDS
jgi:hypothetical protein